MLVDAGDADAETLTVPIHITANRSHPTFSIGGGYGTDTQVRGTLSWTDSLVNDRGHRFRAAITASAITHELSLRYDVPIGDPALERMSMEFINGYGPNGDIDNNTTILRPSVTQMYGRWQTVTSVAATRTTTKGGADGTFTSNLLVPGIAFASVPKNFLGEELFSRTFYAELIGSHSALGSDSNFLQLHLQSERTFDLNYQWHLLLRGEAGASLVDHFSELPAIYRFFAGGDRSVRGFGYRACRRRMRRARTSAAGTCWSVRWRSCATFHGTLRSPRSSTPAMPSTATTPRLEYAAGVGVRYRLPGVALGIDVAKPLSEPNGKTAAAPQHQPETMKLLRRILLGLLVLVLLTPSAVLYWIVSTQAGLRFVTGHLGKIGPVTITVENASGTFADGFKLGSLRIQHRRVDIRITNAEGRLRLLPLLHRQIQLASGTAQQVSVQVFHIDNPTPSGPLRFMPDTLSVKAESLHTDKLLLILMNGNTLHATNASTAAEVLPQLIRIKGGKVSWDDTQMQLAVDGRLHRRGSPRLRRQGVHRLDSRRATRVALRYPPSTATSTNCRCGWISPGPSTRMSMASPRNSPTAGSSPATAPPATSTSMYSVAARRSASCRRRLPSS